jgi:hypothetical protein
VACDEPWGRAASDGTVTCFACLPVLLAALMATRTATRRGRASDAARTPASSPRWLAVVVTGRRRVLIACPLDESSPAFACGHGDRAHATGGRAQCSRQRAREPGDAHGADGRGSLHRTPLLSLRRPLVHARPPLFHQRAVSPVLAV